MYYRLKYDIPYRNDWDKYRRFAIVRNPYTRIVSLYHHFGFTEDVLSFEQFCMKSYDECTRYIKDDGSFHIDTFVNILIIPQYVFVFDTQVTQCMVDRILYFENLDTEWRQWVYDWNLNFPCRLPNKNIQNYSARDPVVWTPRAKRLVQQMYFRDFVYFGYQM